MVLWVELSVRSERKLYAAVMMRNGEASPSYLSKSVVKCDRVATSHYRTGDYVYFCHDAKKTPTVGCHSGVHSEHKNACFFLAGERKNESSHKDALQYKMKGANELLKNVSPLQSMILFIEGQRLVASMVEVQPALLLLAEA